MILDLAAFGIGRGECFRGFDGSGALQVWLTAKCPNHRRDHVCVILFGAREVREASHPGQRLGRREVVVARVEFVFECARQQREIGFAGRLKVGELRLDGAPLCSALTLPALTSNLPAGASGRLLPATLAGAAPLPSRLSASASGGGCLSLRLPAAAALSPSLLGLSAPGFSLPAALTATCLPAAPSLTATRLATASSLTLGLLLGLAAAAASAALSRLGGLPTPSPAPPAATALGGRLFTLGRGLFSFATATAAASGRSFHRGLGLLGRIVLGLRLRLLSEHVARGEGEQHQGDGEEDVSQAHDAGTTTKPRARLRFPFAGRDVRRALRTICAIPARLRAALAHTLGPVGAESLDLVRPCRALREAFFEMYADYAAHGEERYLAEAADYEGTLARLDLAHRGEVPAGLVPSTHYWLLRGDGTLLGGCRLRHGLSESLWQDGGHIGYDIRPSMRNRGYATRMVALALDEARRRGLEWVLLTIAPSNTPSIRVAEKHGARRIGVGEQSGNLQFRIDLPPAGVR